MGLFRKNRAVEEQPQHAAAEVRAVLETLAHLDNAWSEDPAMVLAHFAANSEQPLATIGRTLALLVAGEVISIDELGVLGIDPAEFVELVELLKNENPAQVMAYQAQVREAIRIYDQQIDEILAGTTTNFDEQQRQAFRSQLAAFASSNNLTDLKVAYRLMKAEGVDPLKGLNDNRQAGYL